MPARCFQEFSIKIEGEEIFTEARADKRRTGYIVRSSERACANILTGMREVGEEGGARMQGCKDVSFVFSFGSARR